MLQTVLFYAFAILTLGGAVLTITRRNPVLSAVWLTVSLLGVAGIFLLQGAEFLFAAQIILYVGGVTLLFLFVVMLVNLDAESHIRRFRRAWPVVLLSGAGLATELIILLIRGRFKGTYILQAVPNVPTNTGRIADLLFSRYFLAFELASVLLLVAIVGSVWMGQQRKAERSDAR